jgi:hypothetical protein
MGNSKGFPTSHYMQDLDLYCRSYGDQRYSFHLKARWATQKTSSNIFLANKRKLWYITYVHTYKGSFGSFLSD